MMYKMHKNYGAMLQSLRDQSPYEVVWIDGKQWLVKGEIRIAGPFDSYRLAREAWDRQICIDELEDLDAEAFADDQEAKRIEHGLI